MTDQDWMQIALELAARGRALASPNPMVGAAVVREGEAVGSGFHTYAGVRHAEVIAFDEAGERAHGATLYTTLEPCCHQGRTPPCTERIIASGVKRVVVAMTDPNPVVAGRGLDQLRQAGLAVETRVLEEPAKRLNEAFARHVRTGRPLVTLKAAMTLDGKIASANGTTAAAGWITSEVSRRFVHESLRHGHDAILSGIGTVLKDDPELTDRSGQPRRRPLLRVVLDSDLRVPLTAKVLDKPPGELLIVAGRHAPPEKRKQLEDRGAEIIVWDAPGGRLPLPEVLDELGKRDMQSVLVEAGAGLTAALLEAKLVDKVFLFYAPSILGGGSLALLGETGFASLEAAPRLLRFDLHRFGDDFAVEGYLADPYAAL